MAQDSVSERLSDRQKLLEFSIPKDPDAVRAIHDGADIVKAVTGLDHHDLYVMLGSGLRSALDGLGVENARIPLTDLPGVPRPTAEGHGSELISLAIGDKNILVQTGRSHLYEGFEPAQVCQAPRIAAMTGGFCRAVDQRRWVFAGLALG